MKKPINNHKKLLEETKELKRLTERVEGAINVDSPYEVHIIAGYIKDIAKVLESLVDERPEGL